MAADVSRLIIFSQSELTFAATDDFRATKKPRLTRRRGHKTVVRFSFFPKPMMLELELAPVIETKVQSVAVVSSGQSLNHSL